MLNKKKKVFSAFIGLLIIIPAFFLIMGGCKSDPGTPSSSGNPAPIRDDGDAPVTIYYGLNESHGNSWAQCTSNGMVGVTYFLPTGQSPESGLDTVNRVADGNLMYKTITPEGIESNELVAVGQNLEISVLLFDTQDDPHIFVAESDNTDQIIDHYYKDSTDQWVKENVVNFLNEGGKYIYELSAELGRNGTFHLLLLITRSNPDSDDYYFAFQDANLYHLNNEGGSWQKQLIINFDMFYTMDEYVKVLNRQAIAVDKSGFVHVVYGEQLNGTSNYSPSRLCYASNRTGNWVVEYPAVPREGSRDSAGWYPSLAIDNQGYPAVTYCYVSRVTTGSAAYAYLYYAKRLSKNNWNVTLLAKEDNGYYGTDGRDYTGGLTHLRFDDSNRPHIIFTDIASSHFGHNYMNLGNIRYAVYQENKWDFSTIYRQQLPERFDHATEMYGQCLLISGSGDGQSIQVVGQQMVISDDNEYSCTLIHKKIK